MSQEKIQRAIKAVIDAKLLGNGLAISQKEPDSFFIVKRGLRNHTPLLMIKDAQGELVVYICQPQNKPEELLSTEITELAYDVSRALKQICSDSYVHEDCLAFNPEG